MFSHWSKPYPLYTAHNVQQPQRSVSAAELARHELLARWKRLFSPKESGMDEQGGGETAVSPATQQK